MFVTFFIAVRGIQRGRMMKKQREEFDRQRGETGKGRIILYWEIHGNSDK
jgi:hypothetical protein